VERTFPLRGRGGQRGVAFLPDGTFLANLVVADSGGILPPVHHLAGKGTVLGRFGDGAGWPEYGSLVSGDGSVRIFSPSKAGGFWMIQGNRFEILRLDLDGTVGERIELVGWVEDAPLEDRVQRGYPPTTLMDKSSWTSSERPIGISPSPVQVSSSRRRRMSLTGPSCTCGLCPWTAQSPACDGRQRGRDKLTGESGVTAVDSGSSRLPFPPTGPQPSLFLSSLATVSC